ncbi:hypothetical protein Vafri_21874, partial [Volvox africanus]
HGLAAATAGPTALRRYLLEDLLLEAAVFKRIPLPVVEGAMALLELLSNKALEAELHAEGDNSVKESPFVDDPALLSQHRWQLVVGADVGGVQYIPAVEELEVSSDKSFTLGTDLDFIFTGFRGTSEWLAPGHLSYTVRQMRLELRWPKAWRRAAAWLKWRRRLGVPAAAAAALGDEPDWGDSLPTSPTCREDPSQPAITIPLPFPTNEILAFSCDGCVAATRSRLTNGLILLVEVRTRERMRSATGAARADDP